MFIPAVTLIIEQSGTPSLPRFRFTVFKDSEAILNDEVSAGDSQEVLEISRQYLSLFDKGCRADLSRDYIDLLGSSMFHIWFKRSWELIKDGTRLVVASDVPEVLNLPWELTRFPDGELLGSRFPIRRNAGAQILKPFSGELRPGPLRVLFVSCQPLDYELEDRSVIRAMEGLDLAFTLCNTGSFKEFAGRIREFRPHLVHVLAHSQSKDGQSFLAFEGEGGRQDLKSSSDMGTVLRDGGVQCITIGGCQIKTLPGLKELCRGLTEHVPVAIPWNGSAVDTIALRAFYADLAAGSTLDSALGHARKELNNSCKAEGKMCDLPSVFSSTDQDLIFDSKAERLIPSRLQKEQKPIKGMASGCCPGPVDRRRELERLVPAIREGSIRTLIITGEEGAGKSTLAAMIAQWLGFKEDRIIPVQGTIYNPLSAARLIEAGVDALESAGLKEQASVLKDSGVSVEERLPVLMDELNKGGFLLVLDQLYLKEGRISDQDLSEFYPLMLRTMSSARAIIVSPILPVEALTLPSKAREWSLTGLHEPDFIKFILDDEVVAEKYRSGKPSYDALQGLFKKTRGLPCCLEGLRAALRIMQGDEVESLAGKSLAGEPVDYDNLCQSVLSRLYGSLSPESQKALSQAAVYESVTELSGLQAVTGLAADRLAVLAEEWRRLSMVCMINDPYIDDGVTWAVQNREWLKSKLSQDQFGEAHMAAGIFLEDLARKKQPNISKLDRRIEALAHFVAADDLDRARSVSVKVSMFLQSRGFYNEIIRINGALLSYELHTIPAGWMGRAYGGLDNQGSAIDWCQRAIKYGENYDACFDLGSIYLERGARDQAAESFRKALDISRKTGDPREEAGAWHGLALVEMEKGNNDEARKDLLKVLEIQERTGDVRAKAATLQNIASIDLRQGRYDGAKEMLESSLKILADDPKGAAAVLQNMGSIDLERGAYDLAEGELQKALDLKVRIGDRSGEADVLHNLGLIDVQKGDLDGARAMFQRTLDIYREAENKPGEAGAFFQLGVLAVQQSRILEGLKLIVLSGVILRSVRSDELKSIEPLMDGLASRMKLTQAQFIDMIKEVSSAYRKDEGRKLVEAAFSGSK